MDKFAFMRACREGGDRIEQALAQLDSAYFTLLYRDCARAVNDSESARDLVQETFIKVWQRCATFRAASELLPWIKSILRRTTIDFLRRRQRERRHEMPLDDEELGAQAEQRMMELAAQEPPPPEAQASRHELAECFQTCWTRFAQAHPAHAAVMAWIVFDGLTNEAVAELLDRTPGATREFISQCRKRARIYFGEWYELAFGRSVHS